MVLLYSVIIWIYGLLIRAAAPFNPKAAQWIKGRKGLFNSLQESMNRIRNQKGKSKLIWFHCASLGEFEQGRPIIEKLRNLHPEFIILLTFQSPSGYEVRKFYPSADLVTYLPLDTPGNARRFINSVKPDLVVFVKYEFWFNFLAQLQKGQIPVYLVSAVFRADQHFFKWYGFWPRKILKGFTHIFVQNEYSREVLEFVDINAVTVSGDTRFDRVAEVVSQEVNFPEIKAFVDGYRTLVAGSTWPADEELLLSLFDMVSGDFRMLIIPHEIQKSHIDWLVERCKGKAVLYSQADVSSAIHRIMIVDTIGMLNKIYRYGEVAYIGGGFGVGIHNILEPAAYGMPVVFGPHFRKFAEANDLTERGGAFSIRNGIELAGILDKLFTQEAALLKASGICSEYVAVKKGATELIFAQLEDKVKAL